MYNQIVHSKIELLGQVIADIRDIELAISIVDDPSLIMEYQKERNDLIEELNSVSDRCLVIIEAYMEDCKDQQIPIFLDYYRVYRELKRAQI